LHDPLLFSALFNNTFVVVGSIGFSINQSSITFLAYCLPFFVAVAERKCGRDDERMMETHEE